MLTLLPMQDMIESNEDDDLTYLGTTIADIIRGESLRSVATEQCLCWQTPEGSQVFGYNTDDQHMLKFLPQLQRLYISIMAGDEAPVVPVLTRLANRPVFKLTKVGRPVVDACKYFEAQEDEERNWQQAYAHHQFHPIVAVLLGAVMRWWQPICGWPDPSRPMFGGERDNEGEPYGEAVENLHHLVDFVRNVCRTQTFRNLLQDHENKAKDNFRSGCDYITAQFERHSRLLILRIDLYFRPDARGWGYSNAADKAIFKYLRALRMRRIVPGYLGFIIKRENGISRGVHFHLLVVLDGHLHRSAHYLTQLMGEAWTKRVGREKGSYFNCYARKDRFQYNGLGLVHVTNAEKLLGLRIALWYMSKQDSELKVDDAKNKNFWRSPMPEGVDRRGAPRKNGHGMDLVKRRLGGKRSKYPPDFEPPRQVRANLAC